MQHHWLLLCLWVKQPFSNLLSVLQYNVKINADTCMGYVLGINVPKKQLYIVNHYNHHNYCIFLKHLTSLTMLLWTTSTLDKHVSCCFLPDICNTIENQVWHVIVLWIHSLSKVSKHIEADCIVGLCVNLLLTQWWKFLKTNMGSSCNHLYIPFMPTTDKNLLCWVKMHWRHPLCWSEII